jgi:phenylalanyl-tRNA synthetase beta chain
MRVSLDWLKEWVGFDEDPDVVADTLTTAGLEVDSVEAVASPIEGVVVARVTQVVPHPKADRLSVCSVSTGSSIHEVVCGAPNVAPGIRVPYAMVGARLPGGQRVAAQRLRGVESDGMLCSASELELADDREGLMLLDADAPLGADLNQFLRLDDTVLDLDLTPNRGDCFSMIGVARELAAIQGTRITGPALETIEPIGDDTFAVRLEAPAACPTFVGRIVRGLRNDVASPVWLRERLRRSGIRSIHPVVDVTNYVMLELGQPLHAYDLDRLREWISVRWAKPGERLVLLDGKEVALDDDVLVIADSGGAIGLAGIMGGASTGVGGETTDVLLEAAHFTPDAIAGRARRFGLHTDASLRFERGVDTAGQTRAIERATDLLISIAGGACGPTNVESARDSRQKRPSIKLRHAKLESILGMNVSAKEAQSVLERLSMSVSKSDGVWEVDPPSFRFDINIEEDLIEEVGRMIGYDNIPAVSGTFTGMLGSATESHVASDKVCDLLTNRGYEEVVTYSFVDFNLDEAVSPGGRVLRVSNPISSEQNVMRRSLWPGLLRTAQRNLSRQISSLRLFELGTQFEPGSEGSEHAESQVVAGLAVGRRIGEHWDETVQDVDFFDVKSDVEALMDLTHATPDFAFEIAQHPALNPSQTARIVRDGRTVGWLGALHPELQARLEFREPVLLFALRMDEAFVSQTPVFTPYSKYPHVRRDIAMVVGESVSSVSIVDAAKEAGGSFLREVIVFDVYRGEGIDASRKSVAIGLILQDASRTLTDADAEGTVHSVTQHLEQKLGATIRT